MNAEDIALTIVLAALFGTAATVLVLYRPDARLPARAEQRRDVSDIPAAGAGPVRKAPSRPAAPATVTDEDERRGPRSWIGVVTGQC